MTTKIVHDHHHKRRNRRQTIVPNLPNDISIELLSMLPPKSIVRLRSVCKTWLRLFSNPNFIKIHVGHAKLSQEDNENEYLIMQSNNIHDTTMHACQVSLCNINNPKVTFNMDHSFNKKLGKLVVIGSINGLVCLTSADLSSRIIVLWNPVTNQCRKLPRSTKKYYSEFLLHKVVGFCFDPCMNDYIVFRMEELMLKSRFMFYSLNSNSWKEIDIKVDFSILLSHYDHAIVKDEPYWWARSNNSSPRFVVRFDVCDKMLKRVPRLRVPHEELGHFKLVNYKSLLAVLVDSTLSLSSLTFNYLGLDLGSSELENSQRSININMLVLDNVGLWKVGLRVEFPRGIERIIGCSKRGQMVLEDKSRETVLFDPENKEIESINIVGVKPITLVSNYTPSFVPVKVSK